jgi:hypothetical protein
VSFHEEAGERGTHVGVRALTGWRHMRISLPAKRCFPGWPFARRRILRGRSGTLGVAALSVASGQLVEEAARDFQGNPDAIQDRYQARPSAEKWLRTSSGSTA